MTDSMKAAFFLVGLVVLFIILFVLTLVAIVKAGKRKHAEDDYYDDEDYSYEEEEEDVKVVKKEKKEKKKAKKIEPEDEPEPEYEEDAHQGSEDMDFADEFFDKAPQDSPVESIPEVAFADSAFAEEPVAVPEADSAFAGDSAFGEDSAFAEESDDDYEDEFGQSEELKGKDSEPAQKAAKSKKKSRGEDLPQGDYYWYNRTDVAQRPDYKTPEMYYRYFTDYEDVIEDLLTEMYDCALVRTEEIRYIAYGIEPKMIFGNEALLADNDKFVAKFKTKSPSTKDLVKVYEKWCGYVDRLFEEIEIHADKEISENIKKELCDFGKNEVSVILKGK